MLLRELRLDVSSVGRTTVALNDMPRVTAIRALGSILPDAGSPFTELLNLIRSNLMVARPVYIAVYIQPILPDATPNRWPLAGGGVLLVVLTETLFRLRTVMALRDTGPGGLAGLADSIRIGWQNMGYITARVWALRFATLLVIILFSIVPTIFAQGLVVPYVSRQIGGFWLYAGSSLLFSFSGALVAMLPLAFAIVFDTRLYAALAAGRERW